MRSIVKHRQTIRVVPCRAMQGESGGIWMMEFPQLAFFITAGVRPDRQSERRELGTLRPRERRLLFPGGRVDIRQGDHLYFEGDPRVWRSMQRRDYPLHQEIETEVEG